MKMGKARSYKTLKNCGKDLLFYLMKTYSMETLKLILDKVSQRNENSSTRISSKTNAEVQKRKTWCLH
jgi:hypothetical protein